MHPPCRLLPPPTHGSSNIRVHIPPFRRRVSSGSSGSRLSAAADGGGENNGNGQGEKRELDRLFEEMERANTRSPVGEALKETVGTRLLIMCVGVYRCI